MYLAGGTNTRKTKKTLTTLWECDPLSKSATARF